VIIALLVFGSCVHVLLGTLLLIATRRIRHARQMLQALANHNASLRLELAMAQPLYSRRLLEAAVKDLQIENAQQRARLGGPRGAN
jgi:hypothetical protein